MNPLNKNEKSHEKSTALAWAEFDGVRSYQSYDDVQLMQKNT